MIEIQNVSKSFSSNVAVDDVSISIPAGEFMTFLGPSGCGKTTCLRMISGFEQPDAGRILLNGQDVTDEPPYLRNVNQVFQSYALFPHLNVYDNIAFGLRVKKLSAADIRRKTEKALEMVSLQGTGKRFPSQLSGGERQRVALARALVCEPKVLLLDEPLSALDAKLQEQMRIELKNLQKKLGITFIYVTHDQDHALIMSDRIAVMNAGRIEQIGTAWEIYHNPRSKFVANFIGDTNILDAEVVARNGHVTCQLQGGIKLAANSGFGEPGEKILLSLRPEKIRVQTSKDASENVFRARVEGSVFKGAVKVLNMRTASGLQIKSLQTNDGPHEMDFAVGDDLFCSIAADDVTVLRG